MLDFISSIILTIQIKCVTLHLTQSIIEYKMANLNCIKAVLAEKGIMSKYLYELIKKINKAFR